MCHADVGVFTSNWVTWRDQPWPDFNTQKKCRDFDGILKWVQTNQMGPYEPMVPQKPAGVIELDTAP